MVEIKIFSLMRSGQHAIIDWILNQLSGKIVYINDILHPDCKQYHNTKLCNEKETDYLIYNLEDRFITAGEQEASRVIFRHNSDRIIKILIIRDPYNLFASRYARQTTRINPITGEYQHEEISKCRWTPLKGWTSQAALKCWKDHAIEAIKPTKVDLVIKYNEWFQNKEYRKKIADYLNLNFTDEGIEHISDVGEGSSFDGIKYQNNAKEMKVLQRYKKYKYDNYYISLFDEEIRKMTKEIFNWEPNI